jgi:DNA polymerase (family 10)
VKTNEGIADQFRRFADLLEIRGADHFRVRSYRNAADSIESWPGAIESIAKQEGSKGLQAIPGVGRAISAKIAEIVESGTFSAWIKVTAETPPSVLDLLKVDGIGMKTAATLHQKFKITSLNDLRQFAEGGGLELVDGISDKTSARIIDSLSRLQP